MAVENPHTDDVASADAWEQGYLSGYVEPDGERFPPFSPELLDVFKEGEAAGREDRAALPADSVGEPHPGWFLEAAEVTAEEAGKEWLSHKFFHLLFGKIGGLVSLVVLVLQIPGDVQLQPLEPDWEGPVDQPEDTYVAVCPRTDHGPVLGALDGGYWAGSAQKFYGDALSEVQAHGHAEGFVALCSLADGATEGVCGPAWTGGTP